MSNVGAQQRRYVTASTRVCKPPAASRFAYSRRSVPTAIAVASRTVAVTPQTPLISNPQSAAAGHAGWVWALLGLCIGAMLFMRARDLEPTERAMQWPDALGLGLFSAGGTQLALGQGLPAIVAVLMGVVTAVCGGIIRDVLCNEIPLIFRTEIYATASLTGALLMIMVVVAGAGSLGQRKIGSGVAKA